jgi:hypothetical protein
MADEGIDERTNAVTTGGFVSPEQQQSTSSKQQQPRQQPNGDTPTLRWDDAKMQTRYANVVQVTGTREEIALLLGTHQIWQVGKDVKEVVVPLEERVLLNPAAAKRLLLQLGILLRGYEQKYGAIQLVGDATAAPRPEPLPTKE